MSWNPAMLNLGLVVILYKSAFFNQKYSWSNMQSLYYMC